MVYLYLFLMIWLHSFRYFRSWRYKIPWMKPIASILTFKGIHVDILKSHQKHFKNPGIEWQYRYCNNIVEITIEICFFIFFCLGRFPPSSSGFLLLLLIQPLNPGEDNAYATSWYCDVQNQKLHILLYPKEIYYWYTAQP